MIYTNAFVNTIPSMARVQPATSGGTTDIISTQIQLDGTGVGTITLANADTYEVLSAVYQVAVTDQSAIERYDLATTTEIRLRSTSAINAGANQYVNVQYILASNLS